MFDAEWLRITGARKRAVMTKLQQISDARSGAAPGDVASSSSRRGDGTKPHHGKQAPGVNGSKGHADSSPPPDFDRDCIKVVDGEVIRKSGPPPKTFSLFAHYEHKFRTATDEANRAQRASDTQGWTRALLRIDGLCSQALRDLLLYQGTIKPPRSDTDAGNVERLLTEYRGVPAYEVAVWEMCSVVWIRRSRLLNGVDPETGEERADPRTAKAVKMDEAGASHQAIAGELGISRQRVTQILAAA